MIATTPMMLATREATLELLVAENGWCRLRLHSEGRCVELGGDAKDVVVDRLRRTLTERQGAKTSGEVEGQSVTWVMSLSERHASLYAAEGEEGGLTVFVQAADARLLARVAISAAERRGWSRELDAFSLSG